MRRVRARLDKAQRDLPLLWGAERRADLRRFRPPRAAGGPGRVHVLLAAPGGGNIGDQALLEAFIEQTPGEIRVLVRDEADASIPEGVRERVALVALSHLIYGTGVAHDADVERFIQLLSDAASFAVIGADIMDGRYSLRASIRRATLAQGAHALGVPTRIIGFSWSTRPRVAARRAMVAAAALGVVPCLRDPVSAERARAAGLKGVVETADIVFAGTSRAVPAERPGAPYAVVNASALVGRRIDQTGELADVVRDLRRRDLDVVIVPHVVVDSSDDLAACRALADAVQGAGVTLVERLLTPSEVRGLAGGATIVVTGRMHLAVMAMSQQVPAVTLSTQGKVEGLMRLVGAPELCVTPRAGMAGEVIDVIGRVLPGDSATRASLARAIPGVIELSRRNTQIARTDGEAA